MLQINDRDHMNCLDCGHALKGRFCQNCGQESIQPYSSFWYLIKETLGNYISFDSRLLHTLRPLILLPGKLSMEYSKGRRTRYIHPIRLYVFTSLVVFILFSLTDKWLYRNAGVQFSVGNMEIGNVGALPDSASAEVEDSIFMFDKSYPVFDNQEDFDRYLDTLSTEDQPGWMVRALMRKAMTMAGANNEELATQFRDTFLQAIPKALFFLIPVFALFLRLLYLRSPYFYEEHLVFGLHFHTFLFIAILIFTWLGALSLWCWFLLPVLITWYFWRASYVFYVQSAINLVWRSLSMMVLYGLAIVYTALVLVIITFLLF